MDPFDFYKDRVLIARLSGASKLGQFTAYTCMEVTAEGRRRCYFDLTCGQLVNTPWAKQQGGERVQLPLREGMLCRILLGSSAAGAKKTKATQNHLLCLSFVEKQSRFASTITNPLGLYQMSDRCYTVNMEVAFDRRDILPPQPEHPWDIQNPIPSDDFLFVITAAQYTSPLHYIWKCPTRVKEQYYPSDQRLYTFMNNLDKNNKDFAITYVCVDVFGTGCCCFDQMEERLALYSVPSLRTAVGQAKRAIVEKIRSAKRGREDESSEEDSDENDDE